MTPARLLIAGIGNIFLGDDAFGSEVARKLAERDWPEGVAVEDFGIRGIDLTYALMAGPEYVILVDATPRGGVPGTVYVIEPDLSALDSPASPGELLDAHTLNPLAVLRTVRAMGGGPARLLLVGCEPADLGPEEGRLGLSPVVADAVGRALPVIDSLVARLLAANAFKPVSLGQPTS